MMIGALYTGAMAQPFTPAPPTSTTDGVALHMSAGAFLQPSVSVAKGSKLVLVGDSSSLHVLANGSWQQGRIINSGETAAPRVDNVQVTHGSVEIGPFMATGSYHFYCAVHPGMNLTAVVK